MVFRISMKFATKISPPFNFFQKIFFKFGQPSANSVSIPKIKIWIRNFWNLPHQLFAPSHKSWSMQTQPVSCRFTIFTNSLGECRGIVVTIITVGQPNLYEVYQILNCYSARKILVHRVLSLQTDC